MRRVIGLGLVRIGRPEDAPPPLVRRTSRAGQRTSKRSTHAGTHARTLARTHARTYGRTSSRQTDRHTTQATNRTRLAARRQASAHVHARTHACTHAHAGTHAKVCMHATALQQSAVARYVWKGAAVWRATARTAILFGRFLNFHFYSSYERRVSEPASSERLHKSTTRHFSTGETANRLPRVIACRGPITWLFAHSLVHERLIEFSSTRTRVSWIERVR